MSIKRQHKYGPEEIEQICRASEFRPTSFGRRGEGHTYTQHIAITNIGMARRGDDFVDRWDKEKNRNQKGPPFVAVTSFITNDDAFRAGTAILNSAGAQAALGELDAGQTGMRIVVTDFQAVPIRIRYLTGGNQVKTMPCQWFRIVADRTEIDPYGLHVQTLFPLIDEKAEVRAIVKSRTGAQVKTIP